MNKIILSEVEDFSFSYSQSAQATASGSSQTCAYGSNVSVGDLLIVCVDVFGQAITGVSDSQGNVYAAIPSTPVEQDSTSPRYTAMYWAIATQSAANTVTVSYNQASSGQSTIVVAAYTPAGGSTSLDASGVAQGTSVTSLTATTGAATYPSDLLVFFVAAFSGSGTPTGYTIRQTVSSGTAVLGDSTSSSAGAQSVTETFSSSTAGLILAAFSAVKPVTLVGSL
jgi:hypothetical protein